MKRSQTVPRPISIISERLEELYTFMVATATPSRPDLAAHREAISLQWEEVVSRLIQILGKKLTAYIAGVRDVRALDRWLSKTAPYGDVEARLRFAYQVVKTLAEHDSSQVVQACLTG